MIGVAGTADHLAMFSFQRKVGLVVIVIGLLPGRFDMAIGAFFAETLFVRVGLAMAIDTGGRGLAE